MEYGITPRGGSHRHCPDNMMILRYISMRQACYTLILAWLPLIASEEMVSTLHDYFTESHLVKVTKL